MDLKVWHNPPYNRHSVISPQDISEQWQIGLKQASQTIQVMTQLGVWSALLPMAWCYREDRMFHQWCLNQWFYTDTMFSKYQSVNGNKCAQVFANNSFFIAAYPMSSKDQAGLALGEFINEFGMMKELVMDGAAEQIGKNTDMMKRIRKYDIIHHRTEPEQHNQNRAESAIRELKKKWFRVMVKHKVPKRLWDYGLHWCCDISQRTPNSVFSLEGWTPIEQLTWETPDISKYLDFLFYDYVLVHKNAGLGEQILCWWLGVAQQVGSQMMYYVIKANGQVIARSSVQWLHQPGACNRKVHATLQTIGRLHHLSPQGCKSYCGTWSPYTTSRLADVSFGCRPRIHWRVSKDCHQSRHTRGRWLISQWYQSWFVYWLESCITYNTWWTTLNRSCMETYQDRWWNSTGYSKQESTLRHMPIWGRIQWCVNIGHDSQPNCRKHLLTCRWQR